MIHSFRRAPVQLFRVNNGGTVRLRDYTLRKSQSYDILTDHGKVLPKALEPSSYSAPNGASMRPLGDTQLSLVERFKGSNVIIYAIPEGTDLPEDLILVHEYSDHYSLQPAVEMSLEDLNRKITEFLQKHARQYNKEQWLDTFRSSSQPATSFSTANASSSYSTIPAASYAGSNYSTIPVASYVSSNYSTTPVVPGPWSTWTWNDTYQCNYRYRKNLAVEGDYEYEYDETTAASASSKHRGGKGKGKRK